MAGTSDLPRGFACALLAAGLAAMSCSSLGHRTVRDDQFNYGAAIASASAEQLLMNMVRLRYDVPPVFLTVSSVISQYRQSTSLSLRAGLGTSATGDDTGSVGVGAVWVDRPTITYTPVTGRDFARTFLTPLQPQQIFALLQSGWPADLVVRLSLVSINGVKNEVSRPARRQLADPAFWELMEVMRRLREASALATRPSPEGSDSGASLFLRDEDVTPDIAADQKRFRELLSLGSGQHDFRLTAGLIAERAGDIAVLTRSIRDIMLNLAWRFDVPPEHVTEGRTAESFVSPAPLIQVHFADSRPSEAYVAVESRGIWFYIDDRDRTSKRAFSFLHMLLSLTETPEPGLGPILSIN